MDSHSRYDSLIQFYAAGVSLDWLLLKAEIRAESNFQPDVVNHSSGAKGLCQFMDPTFAEQAKILQLVHASPFDPEDAIACQAHYLKWCMDQFEGDVEKGLAAYNWGAGHLHNLLNGLGDPGNWKAHLPIETQQYIERIMGYWKEYRP